MCIYIWQVGGTPHKSLPAILTNQCPRDNLNQQKRFTHHFQTRRHSFSYPAIHCDVRDDRTSHLSLQSTRTQCKSSHRCSVIAQAIPQTTLVLDITIPARIQDVYNDITNVHDGLLVRMHQLIESENVKISSTLPKTNNLTESTAQLALTYTTLLPLLGLRVSNTEILTIHHHRLSSHGEFSISSQCSTSGVPFSNCFVNRLEWHAKRSRSSDETDSTQLHIYAHTEFIQPVLGVMRSRIEAESMQGIKQSYAVLDTALQQLHNNPANNVQTASPSVIVHNLKRSEALSSANSIHSGKAVIEPKTNQSSKKKGRKKKWNRINDKVEDGTSGCNTMSHGDSSDTSTEHGNTMIQETKDVKGDLAANIEILEQEEAEILNAEVNEDVEIDDDEEEEEEDDDDDDDELSNIPDSTLEESSNKPVKQLPKEQYARTYSRFKNLIHLDEVKAKIAEYWPEWAENRYWLILPTGKVAALGSYPTPDEAVGLLKTLNRIKGSEKCNVIEGKMSRDPLLKGLVECLRLTPPRRPTIVTARVLSMSSKGHSRHGSSSIKSPFKRKYNSTNSTKNTGDQEVARDLEEPETADNEVRLTATTSTPVLLSTELSSSSIHPAIMSLGRLAGKSYFIEEMNALCDQLPRVEFRKMNRIYAVLWSLRYLDHWTQHLPLLEAKAVALLESKIENNPSAQPGGGSSGTPPHSTGTQHSMFSNACFCAQCLVHLGHEPVDLLAALAARITRKTFSIKAAGSLAWCIAISNSLDSPLVPILLSYINKYAGVILYLYQRRRYKGKRYDLGKIWQLFLTLEQMHRTDLINRDEMSTKMIKALGACQEVWLTWTERIITSTTQKEVCRTMSSLGYEVTLETTLCGLSVDILAEKGKYEPKIAVEVDGFSHFARNIPGYVVGNALWKRRLLEANGWLVLNVSVSHWHGLRKTDMRREYLQDLINIEMKKRNKNAPRGKRKREGGSWPTASSGRTRKRRYQRKNQKGENKTEAIMIVENDELE